MSYQTGHGPYDDGWPNYGPQQYETSQQYGPQQYGPQQYGPVPQQYGPQPGWDPAYGPAFGAPVAGPVPNPAVAFASAALFIACSIMTFVFAFSAWGGSGSPHLAAGLVGIVFSDEVTGNADFAISATMTVACSTMTFALALFARLNALRWLLVAIGALVTVYYFFALLYIAANGGVRFVAMPTFALLLWAAATAVALLPATANAMRRPR